MDFVCKFKKAPDEQRKTQIITYQGFAKLIKELFENQLQSLPIKTEQAVRKEKEREQTVDWMTKWLQQQSKDLE